MPLAFGFLGNDLSGQAIHVFTTRSKNIDSMVTIQNGSVGPDLEAMSLAEGEAFLQFIGRELIEGIELAPDEACIRVEGLERNHRTLVGRW